MNYISKITILTAQLLSLSTLYVTTVAEEVHQSDSIKAISDTISPTISAFFPDTIQDSGLIADTSSSLTAKPIVSFPKDTSKSDSTAKKKLKIQLRSDEHARKSAHYHDELDIFRHNLYHLNPTLMFGTDATAPSDGLRLHPMGTSIRYGLSTTLNRYLPFGNTAPVNRFYTGNILFNRNSSITGGSDLTSSTEISDIYLLNSGSIKYDYYPNYVVVPEAVLLWENGVFDENTLNVRLSRPMSRQLTLSVFSNYRYFKGSVYNQAVDITSFFSKITDTSFITKRGYYPLTDEQLSGAALTWKKSDNAIVNFRLTYGDLTEEIILDTPQISRENFRYALIKHYPLQFSLNSSLNATEKLFIDIEGKYSDEPYIKMTGVTVDGKTTPERKDAKAREVDVGIRSGIAVSDNDSLGISYTHERSYTSFFNSSTALSYQNRPELFYTLNFNLRDLGGSATLAAGAAFNSLEGNKSNKPVWNAGLELYKNENRFRIYGQMDNIPFNVTYDSLVFDQPILDTYLKTGLELYWKWNRADLLLGYQYLLGPDSSTVAKSWVSGTAPHKQPNSSIMLAPGFGRWHGLALRTRAIVSDQKPYVKAMGALSFVAHPMNTKEFIDITLSIDYWSERDPVTFAGYSDWGDPVYNAGLEMAAHIRSFRLFYKVDNFLNRRNSYVPGYYSPGITFRWGFNWYLQK